MNYILFDKKEGNMKRLIYLDNAATTRLDPEVFLKMQPCFTEFYGNPSSIYQFHRQIMFVNYMPFLCLAFIGADR